MVSVYLSVPKWNKKRGNVSQEAVERFLGRLLTDDSYRQLAMRSVSDACQKAGYSLSAEELMAITRGDLARIELIAERLDGAIKRFQLRQTE